MIYPQAAELYTAFAALTIPPFLRAKNQVLKYFFCRFGVRPLENMTYSNGMVFMPNRQVFDCAGEEEKPACQFSCKCRLFARLPMGYPSSPMFVEREPLLPWGTIILLNEVPISVFMKGEGDSFY